MADLKALAQPEWSCADDESLSLIFSLLHEDALQVKSWSKGKQVEGTLSDADLALRLYTEELEQATTYVSDRRMTRSMQEAVCADANALIECEREESMARNDRQIAVARGLGTPQEEIQISVDAELSIDEPDLLDELERTYITGVNVNSDVEDGKESSYDGTTEIASGDIDGQPESSSWAASRRPWERPCTSCSDIKHVALLSKAPCQHEYCLECLENLFRNAMLDESFFPPRCCRQEIPVDENRRFLRFDLYYEFKGKYLELSTPNRTYCHRETCSKFIPPSMIEDGVAQCPECETETCVTCKGATHQGDCPADEALQQVLEVAAQEGWQRCPQCFTMIELDHGCFHMTCKCRAEFCYLCAAQWKTCACEHWEERRLYDRAEEIYNRDHDPDDDNVEIEGVDPQPDEIEIPEPDGVDLRVAAAMEAAITARQLEIERIMENLRENHECEHESWRSRGGRHRCEACHQQMPVYIYECRQCSIMACRRCRYNRL